MGNVGGDVSFRALGDIVGGDKITTVTTTIQISVEAVTQRPLITASPYRGLDRLQDRDSALFFGRDQLIKALLTDLSATNVRFVLGASGSGKSSVVRAGLLPRLSQLVGARFRYFTLVPDVNPFQSLRSALQVGGFSQAQTRELLDAQPDALIRLIRGLQREGDQWLIFVDQFEEIFTISDARLRASFIAALLRIAQDPTGSIKLVLAMRGDFFDRFSPYPEFAKLLEKNIALVADMQVDEVRLAIEQPAAQHGVVFEQGLVEEIIEDVQGQAGSLPLLQYTLNLLWQDEERGDGLADRHLNTQTYRELGGVRGALQKRADEIYASFGDSTDSKGDSEKQKIVRQIFLRVVDIAGKDADEVSWRPVRRRVPKELFGTPKEQEVLQELIDQKLLVSSGRRDAEPTVEVAHEALFTSWERLKGWIEGGKQVIFARNRLADDARRWQNRRLKDEAGAEEELLSGSRLGQALDMRARGDFVTIFGGLSETETQFLDASAALRDRRRQEEQEREQRELAQAQALATEQAKAVARQRKFTIAVGFVSLVAVVAGVVSWMESRKAVNNERKAVTNEQKAVAAEKKTSEVASRGSVSLARYSEENGKNAQALAQLAQALRLNPENREASGLTAAMLTQLSWPVAFTGFMRHDAEVLSARFSPDGQRVVTVSEDNTVQLWDAPSGKPIGQPMKHEVSAQFSPDGQRVVTVSEDNTVQLWDARSGKPIGQPMKHGGNVNSAQFSPDGQRVVTASGDTTAPLWDAASGKSIERVATADTVQLWDAASGRPIGQPMKHEASIKSAQFSPDGRRVVTASGDTTARLWDVASGKQIGEPIKHEGIVSSAQFSPDGQRVVTASEDKTARLWDAASGKPIGQPMKHEAEVLSAQFSPDGQRVVTASGDNTARLWDAASGKSIGEPMKHEASVNSAQFSPDGQRVVTVSQDNTVQLWDAASGKPIGQPMKHGSNVNSAQFSPDGQRVVTASGDEMALTPVMAQMLILMNKMSSISGKPTERVAIAQTVQLWDGASGKPIGQPMKHEDSIKSAQFSPDGQRVVVASGNTARLWDAASGKSIGEPMKHEAGVKSAQFSPDGQRVVTASEDKTARLWDAASGKSIGAPMKHEAGVNSARFSPDGQRVVTALQDNTVQLWDAPSGKPIGAPMKHEAGVNSAQFSPDGQRVVTVSQDNTVQLWDAPSGKPIGAPMKHEAGVNSAQFSPGQRVVTASEDKTAQLWDAASGKPIGQPMKHEAAVRSAQFSHDGQRVVTASDDKTARLWDAVIATDKDTTEDVRLLAELAEATGGVTLETAGQAENLKLLTPEQIRESWEKIAAKFLEPTSKLTPLQRFMKWSVSDRRSRTISPFSQLTVPEWLENRIKEGTVEGLRAAMQVDPANARLTAHLGRCLAGLALKQGSDPDEARRARGETDFLTSRAVKLAPDSDEVKKLRDEVVKLLELKTN